MQLKWRRATTRHPVDMDAINNKYMDDMIEVDAKRKEAEGKVFIYVCMDEH